MRKWLGGAAIALTVVLGGCSGEHSAPPPQTTTSAVPQEDAGPAEAAAPPAAPPAEIFIPKINAKSSLVRLGLNADQTVEVPPVSQPMQAGWYDKAPAPGEIGPSVILGHVDGNKQPGIFFRLKELTAGDEISVSRTDGTNLRFVVDRIERVAKDGFPTDKVYGDTDLPELRLITCGGEFDRAAHSYKDNIIVFATLA